MTNTKKPKIACLTFCIMHFACCFCSAQLGGDDWAMYLPENKLMPVASQNTPAVTIIAGVEQQTKLMLNEIQKAKLSGASAPNGGAEPISPKTLQEGNLKLVSSRDWTSGFFAGELWLLYEATGKREWREEAEKFTAKMEVEKTNRTTHDMGFKIYNSFGAGYRLTKDARYKAVIIQAARTLSTRFNPTAGVIRSWDHHKEKWAYPVIIDNMLNLELLFAATRLTGDSSFYKIAVAHANTTKKNHYRSDYSSYHVVDYDTATGKVIKKNTHQGYSDESAWARGQAWGLYGYTMCYRETKDKVYLEQAQHIASFILKHPNMPRDLVPYWDFNAPGIPNEPRDASAAAILASGLYELSLYSANGEEYRKTANKIMANLTRYYRAPVGEAKGFLLLHSTGSKPSGSEVDAPLIYGDYYYLEALLRMKKPDTIVVSSIPALENAISAARPGNVIFLADGIYTTNADIAIDKAGTASKPITIAAKNAGASEITGLGGFNLVSPAAYIIIKGFRFTHSASKAKTGPGTGFCRFTQNTFETPGKGEDLTIAGTDHQIDHNTFRNKNAMGRFLAVRGTGSQIAQNLWIHHNYLKSHKDQGGANGEDCAGENELISIKASAITIRYNTIRNCPAQFTLRHGNKSLVYGNYFINTPGLRIFGDDHVIHSNYFENCNSAITVGNGDGEVADGAKLTSHDRPDRVLIAFNTMVNNKANIIQSRRKEGMGATYISVVNNIFEGGGPAASLSGPYTNPVWKGNIVFKAGKGDIPQNGYSETDPKLVRGAGGIFHLRRGAPAINAVTNVYDAVTADMDGQPRTIPLDKGSDEYSSAPVRAGILDPKDVGQNSRF